MKRKFVTQTALWCPKCNKYMDLVYDGKVFWTVCHKHGDISYAIQNDDRMWISEQMEEEE